MLGHRLRRWPSVNTILFQRLVFAELSLILHRNSYSLLCFPSHREVGTCCFTFVRSVRLLSLCLCVPSYRAGGQTRDVDPMLGWCWPTVCDAGPASNQHWFNASCLLGLGLSVCAVVSLPPIHFSPALSMVQAVSRVVFSATLNVGQCHTRRANINPALVQSIVTVLYRHHAGTAEWSTD